MAHLSFSSPTSLLKKDYKLGMYIQGTNSRLQFYPKQFGGLGQLQTTTLQSQKVLKYFLMLSFVKMGQQ